ncbi:hypothetical protein [Pseudobdellovibrio exovorus]|uniref:Uncharacterized protein n=1 Tax=Pseudobdellovibrio exovorus JSS TaxID=1184267 RepID=M4VML7_9BACT|nr:hypothetical protein [Pseudobdellovibrio exovorus]AGH94329.1 hypothetical protein A11Q_109 [Pseudobdellovibrio exovorus JSS]
MKTHAKTNAKKLQIQPLQNQLLQIQPSAIFKKLIMAVLLSSSLFAQAQGHSSSLQMKEHPNMSNRYIVLDPNVELLEKQMKSDQAQGAVSIEMLMAAIKEGPGVGGGGFSYSRAAIQHIVNSVKLILNFLNEISEEEFQLLQSKWQKQYPSKAQLIQNILQIRLSPTEQTYANGLLGLEPLMADFRGSSETQGYVSLQKKLFDTFNNESDTSAVETITRIILHEVSHLYHIGIQNDEESFQLSRALAGNIIQANKNTLANCASTLQNSASYSRALNIETLQVVLAKSEAACCGGVEAIRLEEITTDNSEPRFAIHLALTGRQGYDRDQFGILGDSVCQKLKSKISSPLNWTLERNAAVVKSTYGYYCAGY